MKHDNKSVALWNFFWLWSLDFIASTQIKIRITFILWVRAVGTQSGIGNYEDYTEHDSKRCNFSEIEKCEKEISSY